MKSKKNTSKIFEVSLFFFKYFLCLTFLFDENFLSLNISTLPSYFVGHFIGHFFVTHKLTNSQTECSTYRAAMSQLKRKTIKIKETRKFEKQKKYFKNFRSLTFFLQIFSMSHFSFWWKFSKSQYFYPPLLFCWTFYWTFFRNTQTN